MPGSMLSTLAVAALLTLSDPPGDALGQGTLTAPSATLFRERDVFDIRSVSVPDTPTFGLELGMASVRSAFPQVLLELYLTEADTDGSRAGTEALLPGSGMRLPLGQRWHYAVRITGRAAQLFDGRSGAPRDVTEAAGVALSASGTTLRLRTALPRPEHFSLYGMSGSYDPFSPDGWRKLRETSSPWGFSGDQSNPVLDVIADTAEVQEEALAQNVLPEIRASFREPGWLLVAGLGVALAVAALAARIRSSRGGNAPPPLPGALPTMLVTGPETPLSPLYEAEVQRRLGVLAAFGRGDVHFVFDPPKQVLEPEPVMK